MKTLKILIFILVVSVSKAQETNIDFENISTFSGLSASQAKCIFQDSDGYLWIGTIGGGLNCYDGYAFTIFKANVEDSVSLIHDNIYSLAEDESGNIWIATSAGLSKYIKGENRFINYNFRTLFKELSNIGYYSTFEVFIDSKDRLWVGDSYFGALRYNKDEDLFEPVPQQSKDSIDAYPQVYGDFTEDKNGIIWASAGGSGLFWYDEENRFFRPAKLDGKNWALLKSKIIFRILSDSENNIWVMTRTDLYKYITGSQELVHLLNYEAPNPISSGMEGELLEDSAGNMLMVHSNLLNPITFPNLSNEYTNIYSEGLTATDIFEDSFGNFWVTDWFQGIYKQVPTKQKFYQIKDKDNLWGSSRISTIYQSRTQPELLYISSSEYGRSDFRSYNVKTAQIENYNISGVSAMISNDEETFWLGTWGNGLLKWNKNTGQLMSYFADSSITPNLFNASITNIKQGDKGKIWIGTLNGLYRMDQGGNNLDRIIEGYGISSTYYDGDILWIGAYNGGLIKYNLISKENEIFQHNKTSNSLSNNIVWDIYRDTDGFLWIATQGGLNRLDLRTNEFKVYTEADGLESNYIAALLPGDYGSIWLSTNSGITHLQKNSNGAISFSNYNTMDGLGNPNFRYPYKLKDQRGRIYFGGQRGLFYFTPHKRKSKPPITYISDLRINGKSIINSKSYNFSDIRNGELNLELNHNENTLSFEFIAIHFAQPSQNRYSYYLEGYESDWQYSKQRSVQYVNLEPGEYSFHLRGANRDGIWNTEEIILTINIGQPWWNTWYAYLLYFGLVVGGLSGIRKFELNRRRETENTKLLEAENRRKSEELEEARALQLSMLPREIPQLPNIDIAVYMKTATEVGGDYYDFHVGLDGTFTAVIGDATGHGMKAGTMVTSSKNLFSSYAENDDIINTFHEMTRCIKNMHLDNLSMCLTMIKIKNNIVRMSSAGMPPIYIYRKNTSAVEEYMFEGMPLGTMRKFPYAVGETSLGSGDVILLMSDGFPELVNDEDEMFGFTRTKHLFEECGLENPETIINRLKSAGSEWSNDKDPDDDITFVVIKVK